MGRKRRSSNSTVATVDEDTITYAKETSVLKLAVLDENSEEETYVLEDVTVYGKDGQMANLLSVYFDGPVVVRGFIKADEGQQNMFRKRTTKSAYIEITDCVRYSVGIAEGEEKSPCVWAGGKCGWFEIRPPSIDYTPIYNKMAQAVSLYYNMLEVHDAHREAVKLKKGKRKGKRPSNEEVFKSLDVDTMFFQYAVIAGDGSLYHEVIDACDEHASFLIAHCYEEEDFDWTHTTFFVWLTQRHKELTAKVEEIEKKKKMGIINPAAEGVVTTQQTSAADPPSQKALSRTSQRRATRSTSAADEEVDTQDFAPQRTSRRSKSTEQASAAPVADVMDIDPQPKTQENPLDDPVEAGGIAEDDTRSPGQRLADAFEFVRSYHNIPPQKMTLASMKSQVYYKYKMKTYEAPAEIFSYYASELLPLLDEQVWGASALYRVIKEAAERPRITPTLFEPALINEYTTPRAKNPAAGTAIEHHRKPIGKSPSMGHNMETPPRKVGRPSGKMSGLRPSFKRALSDYDSEDSRAAKVAKTAHIVDDEEDNSESDTEEDEEEDLAADGPPPVKVVIRTETLLDTTPKGPHGTWVCDQEDDCDFVERNPGDSDGRERIQQHIKDAHYEEQDEHMLSIMNLAKLEGGKGHLPVDHLLEKIRAMGEKTSQNQQKTINGQTVPQPIKRRLLI
ncbi:hypothetical protein BN1708_005602 [Verticillium longisporum]|uniref:DNA (cytosine-5)-methyltransferase 1 replication foci domain-containing protein n=1 Tax=Verticillium longisporum TaxID=100787 RepID=A0A0G4MCD3_VERLO|nr:hypothetical protein BN1708_005602 [Verticillium longisporum]